tara:strand:- start:128 stop:517 length:390 start_codon:yes stop_codon:yes gene_type:complete
MKKLLLISTLLFSTVMFSSPSYGEWTKLSENVNGRIYYVDFERIRKHDGYVYYWTLSDYLKPSKYGDLSERLYNQGDCKIFRWKILSYSFHKEPMGEGTGEIQEPVNKSWQYPPPNSSAETILKQVCSE